MPPLQNKLQSPDLILSVNCAEMGAVLPEDEHRAGIVHEIHGSFKARRHFSVKVVHGNKLHPRAGGVLFP